MPTPSAPLDALRDHAGQALHAYGSLLADLVLDPVARLRDRDLEALKATRDVLVDLAFVGSSRRSSRGLSGSTDADQLARASAFRSTADAHAFLLRLDHSLTLLQRLHGPQAVEVRTAPCDLPHEHEGEPTRG